MNRKDFFDFLNFLVYDIKSDLNKIKSWHFASFGPIILLPYGLFGITAIIACILGLYNCSSDIGLAIPGIVGQLITGLIISIPMILLRKTNESDRKIGGFLSGIFGVIFLLIQIIIIRNNSQNISLDSITSFIFSILFIPILISLFFLAASVLYLKERRAKL